MRRPELCHRPEISLSRERRCSILALIEKHFQRFNELRLFKPEQTV